MKVDKETARRKFIKKRTDRVSIDASRYSYTVRYKMALSPMEIGPGESIATFIRLVCLRNMRRNNLMGDKVI